MLHNQGLNAADDEAKGPHHGQHLNSASIACMLLAMSQPLTA